MATAMESAQAPTMATDDVESTLRAALDVIDDVDGLGLLVTNCGPEAPPNSRVVKTHRLDAGSALTGPRQDLDRIYVATNRWTDKFAEVSSNPLVSLSFYTTGESAGNYAVLRGRVARVLDLQTAGDGPDLVQRLWKDEEMLPFFQGGAEDERFCLLEFLPSEISVISAKHGVAAQDNGWRPAKLDRVGGSWRLREDDISPDRLRRLRGAYDADGRPLAQK